MLSIAHDEIRELAAYGWAQMEKNNHGAAVLIFDGLYRAHQDPNHLLQAAIAARRGGASIEADRLFTDLLQQNGTNYGYCMEAGLFKFQETQYVAAFDLFQKAYAIKPTSHAAVWSGMCLARQGEHRNALAYFQCGLTHDPALLSAKVELASSLESLDDILGAIRIYSEIIGGDKSEINPSSLTYIYNRLGICFEGSGNLGELSSLLDNEDYWKSITTNYMASCTLLWSTRLNKPIEDGRVLTIVSKLKTEAGFNQVVDALSLRLVAGSQHIVTDITQLTELLAQDAYGRDALKIIDSYRLEDILHVANSFPFIDLDPAVDMIVDAIRSGRSFSLVRIGDGEGNLLGHRLLPESLFLAEQNRKILTNWFGSFARDPSEYGQLHFDLHEAMVGADLLGVPDASRIWLELVHEPRGFWGVYFAVHYIHTRIKQSSVVSAGIHSSLFRNMKFLDALRSSEELNTISCHEDFGNVVRSKMGISGGCDLLVPGEMGIRQLPSTSKNGDHYPFVYERIGNQIAEMGPGSVTLIGAGVCGKVYSNRVKKAGGIGIDIGAMADFIMGLETREMFKTDGFRMHYAHLM